MFSLLQPNSGSRPRRWQWAAGRIKRARSLRLLETVALGDRRFVALIEADGQRLLIGATPQSMTLLSDLSATARSTGNIASDGGPLASVGVH